MKKTHKSGVVGVASIRGSNFSVIFALHRRCESTREENECCIILAIKMKARAYTVAGRGDKGPLCDPGSELLLGERARVVRG